MKKNCQKGIYLSLIVLLLLAIIPLGVMAEENISKNEDTPTVIEDNAPIDEDNTLSNTQATQATSIAIDSTNQTEPTEIPLAQQNDAIYCSYHTHIENIGWQDWRSKGELSGTTGQALRLEGIEIKTNDPTNLGIQYQTHVENIGWQEWKSDGAMSGTSGQLLRLEAIRIELTGTNADQYDVYYQVHAENFGWLDWAKNGESAGTEAYAYRLEAIKIVVVPKDSAPPGATDRPFVKNVYCSYQTHLENIGWQSWRSKGELSGTTGQALRLEGIEIKTNDPTNLGIQYQTHVENIGWQDWKCDGAMSGTSGQLLRLEAIRIELTGTNADKYDVYYQVHAENFGWLGWAKNGESSGTTGYGYRLEAIRIVIIKKGENPPTSSMLPFAEAMSVEGNLLIQSNSSDFNGNAICLENVEISNTISNGAIILKSGAQNGVYTSKIFTTSPFNKLVLSWNGDTPEGTSFQVEARVSENTLNSNGQLTDTWSNWLSWGTWGTTIKRASGTGMTDDSLASVDVDTLAIKDGATANKIQYRVILNSDQFGKTPTVRLVSGALRNTIPGQGIPKVFQDNPDLSNLKVLDVPQLSQMVRDPSIADSICSPTSLSMVLNYFGTQLQPEECAWGVYDYNYKDFGNWPFNTAYASSFGYKAYVDYSTIDGLKREISSGHPPVVAVAYKNSVYVGGNLPVIDGAPIASTEGHLIVVCGFTKENGTDYIIINDPAASSNAGVRVKYRLDQFKSAWAASGNIAYIIHN